MLASSKWARSAGPSENRPARTGGPTGALPPSAAAPGAVRGGALDVLRFVASMLIVLYHFGAEAPTRLELVHPVFSRGYLATDFFLILSGFVLGRAYGRQVEARRISDGRFWLKRAGRIWPGHAIMLAAFALTVLAFNFAGATAHNPTRFTAGAFFLQFFLIHAWGIPGGDGWNLPSWSLSALIVCYAAFPLVWRGLAKLPWAWMAPLIGAAGVVAVDLLCWRLFGRTLFDLGFEKGLIRAAPLFLLGACLARGVETRWLTEPLARVLLWGGIATLVGVQVLGRYDVISITALAAIMLGAGRLPVKTPWPLAEQGAKLSYALFITHTFVGFFYYLALHTWIMLTPVGLEIQWPIWVLGFATAVWGAWAFDRWIDGPIQKALAPFLSPPKARPTLTLVPTTGAPPPPTSPGAARRPAAPRRGNDQATG